MSNPWRLTVCALAFVAGLMTDPVSAVRAGGGSWTAIAEARVGRPATPVSVAGVARRSVRRCAVGVYDC